MERISLEEGKLQVEVVVRKLQVARKLDKLFQEGRFSLVGTLGIPHKLFLVVVEGRLDMLYKLLVARRLLEVHTFDRHRRLFRVLEVCKFHRLGMLVGGNPHWIY